MWSLTEDFTLLENIIVRSIYKDNVFKWYELYPAKDYILRIPSCDVYETDEEGNYIYDENGKKILVEPYYSTGGAMEMPDYDWEANPENYYAEKLKEQGE